MSKGKAVKKEINNFYSSIKIPELGCMGQIDETAFVIQFLELGKDPHKNVVFINFNHYTYWVGELDNIKGNYINRSKEYDFSKLESLVEKKFERVYDLKDFFKGGKQEEMFEPYEEIIEGDKA